MTTEGKQALDLLRRIAEALERAHPREKAEPRGLMDKVQIVVAKPEKSAHNYKHDELRPKQATD